MSRNYDAIIVGGGVIGCSIAYYLSKRNQKVIVLEKNGIGEKASGAAAGMLGAQMEFTCNDPLYPLAIKSRDMFQALSEELYNLSGIDMELIEEGIYQLAFTNEEAILFQKQIDQNQVDSQEARWLTSSQLYEREPAITTKVLGALFLPRDGQVSAQKLTKAFMRSAIHLGAELLEHTEVVSFIKKKDRILGVETENGAIFSKNTILASGVWSSELEPTLEMQPVKGECLSFTTKNPLIKGTIKYKNSYLVPKRDNRIIVGATSIPGSFDRNNTFLGMFALMEKAKEMVPSLAHAHFEKAWSGLRPQTKKGAAYIGPHERYQQLFVAAGHYRNGILLSPITGTIIAEQILQKAVF